MHRSHYSNAPPPPTLCSLGLRHNNDSAAPGASFALGTRCPGIARVSRIASGTGITCCAHGSLIASFALHASVTRIAGIPLVAGRALGPRIARVASVALIALRPHWARARTKRERCQQQYGRY